MTDSAQLERADEARERPAEFVEALAKGLAILEAFDAQNPEMTLSEVARRVALSPAATRRSLLTLKTLGYVGQRDKRFHLRPKLMTLGSSFFFSAGLDDVLQPNLRALVNEFGDASSVGALDGDHVIYVAHHSVQRARRATAVLGARYPAYATSLGRVLLAGLHDARLDRYLRGLKPIALTGKTITDIAELREQISNVRENGYATTVDQLDYGITALAVPIRNDAGETVAALNSSGYTGLVTPDDLVRDRLHVLREVAGRIADNFRRYPVLVEALRP